MRNSLKVIPSFSMVLLFISSSVSFSDSKASKIKCKVAMWQPTSELQRLSISPIVVLGHTMGYTTNGDGTVFHATFQVSCVLKSDLVGVKQNITLENIYPRTMCSGSKNALQKGKLSVIGLQRLENGNYDFFEKNPLETIAIDGHYELVHNISNTCGLQNWTVPLGSNDSECPICASDYGLVGNNTCMMGNLYTGSCDDVPEFKIFSVCQCAEKGGTVFSGEDKVRLNYGLLLLIASLAIVA